jgi:hypothetical protein
MKDKIKIGSVVLIGLLMAAGLILIGCGEECTGSGECTVTIAQGTSGLYVDYDSPRSSCGDSAEWNSDYSSKTGGCKVQNNIDGYNRTYGTHGCDCEKGSLF